NEEIGASYPHHHPKFDFDEKAMIYAGKALLSIVHQYTVKNADQILEEPAY
ncbi:MAG: amidohydrolase, partial [Bacillus sp. (in: firmicutes)]